MKAVHLTIPCNADLCAVARCNVQTRTIADLPDVRSALAVRVVDARIDVTSGDPLLASFQGAGPGAPPPWTILRGHDAASPGEVSLARSYRRFRRVTRAT